MWWLCSAAPSVFRFSEEYFLFKKMIVGIELRIRYRADQLLKYEQLAMYNGVFYIVPPQCILDNLMILCSGLKFPTACFFVMVQVPPSIDISSSTQSEQVVQNQTALLTCAADGDPYPDILWLRHNELLDPTGNLVDVSTRGRQLRIHSAQVTALTQYLP